MDLQCCGDAIMDLVKIQNPLERIQEIVLS